MENPSQDEGNAVAVLSTTGTAICIPHALPVLAEVSDSRRQFSAGGFLETGQVPWYTGIFWHLKVFPKDELEIG